MTTETVHYIIPSFQLRGMFAIDLHTMFLTNRRIILILSGKDYSTSGLLLGGLLGYATAKAFSWEHTAVNGSDLDSLLKEDKANLEIDLANITDVRFQKVVADDYYSVKIFGFEKSNKEKKLIEGFLIPSQKDIADNKKKGYKTKVIYKQYALECQNRIEYVLGNKVTKKLRG